MKRKTDNFNKFYNKKRNSAIKEEFRQEKKAEKRERKEGIERLFEERRKAKEQAAGTPNNPAQRGPGGNKGPGGSKGPVHKGTPLSADGEHLPLNKYIAHGGICSRRDAAELIRKGKVTVNGKSVTEPGTKVMPTDLVKVNDKKVTISRNFVYILLNKPKDYITTTDDPQGRRTVLDLIRAATTERVYPVGRLDRNTSGVLLLTNDGDLSQKLAHPSHEIKKVYHVTLDKALTKADFDSIINGVTLEDGLAHVDVMAYADARDKAQIGLEIHSGRNRIVRRIFEHLGYDVRGLDRVMYAGLTKKNVQRGKWRFLNEREIRILKYLNSSIKGSAARAKDWAAIPPTPDAPATKKATASPAKPAAQAKPAAASQFATSKRETSKRETSKPVAPKSAISKPPASDPVALDAVAPNETAPKREGHKPFSRGARKSAKPAGTRKLRAHEKPGGSGHQRPHSKSAGSGKPTAHGKSAGTGKPMAHGRSAGPKPAVSDRPVGPKRPHAKPARPGQKTGAGQKPSPRSTPRSRKPKI
jgi:23S rRNA pseudouridine2605 synthase